MYVIKKLKNIFFRLIFVYYKDSKNGKMITKVNTGIIQNSKGLLYFLREYLIHNKGIVTNIERGIQKKQQTIMLPIKYVILGLPKAMKERKPSMIKKGNKVI